MVVLLVTRQCGVQNSADVDDTLRDAGEKCRGSAGFITSGMWLERPVQHTETFGAQQ